jgi:hypothetical protein
LLLAVRAALVVVVVVAVVSTDVVSVRFRFAGRRQWCARDISVARTTQPATR